MHWRFRPKPDGRGTRQERAQHVKFVIGRIKVDRRCPAALRLRLARHFGKVRRNSVRAKLLCTQREQVVQQDRPVGNVSKIIQQRAKRRVLRNRYVGASPLHTGDDFVRFARAKRVTKVGVDMHLGA